MKAEVAYSLNRLMAILARSFPQYLRWSRPYVPPGRGELLEAFEAIADDQDAIIDRISQMLLDADQLPRTGQFPMEFTDLHDLSIDFLLRVAIDYQSQDLAAMSALVDELRTAPAAKAIAEEAVGMTRGHLDTLEELNQPAAAAA